VHEVSSFNVGGQIRQIVEGKASSYEQEAPLLSSDRAMRLVSSNLANYHATVQKLLIRQVTNRFTNRLLDSGSLERLD